MNRVEARNTATRLAASDTEAALAIAREINDAWFGCQALAWVARFAPEDQVDEIIQMALYRASTAEDPFNQVGASAWVLRALVERGRLDQVKQLVPELIQRAQDISLYASRSEALFALFQAARPCSDDVWNNIFGALVEASSPLVSWRQGRNLRDCLLMVAGDYPELVEGVLEKMGDAKLRRHIQRRLDAKEFRTPREFFWKKAA